MESLQATDEQAKAVQKTSNRVALADIEDAIQQFEYYHPDISPGMTVCFVLMKNGFVVIGKFAPADPANYNLELGRKFAREDAIRQLWPMMGFALRDRMMGK